MPEFLMTILTDRPIVADSLEDAQRTAALLTPAGHGFEVLEVRAKGEMPRRATLGARRKVVAQLRARHTRERQP